MGNNKNEAILKRIKASMQDYYSDRGIEKPSNFHIGKAFGYTIISEIIKPLNGLEDDIIEEGFVDGKNDLGIDFIFKDMQNKFHIYQFKYKSSNKKATHEEIAAIKDLHNRLKNEEYVCENANAGLRDILDEFNPDRDKVSYNFFCSSGFEENLIDLDNEEYNDSFSINYYGIDRIREEFKRVYSLDNTPPRVEIDIQHISTGAPAYLDTSDLFMDSKYESAVFIVKGSTIKNLYSEHKDSLFTYNIRGFLGKNNVNKKIEETILKNPDLFFYLNNGISAICTNFEFIGEESSKHKKLICKDFQIINGAQTVSTISRIRRAKEENLSKVQVLLRLTKTGSNSLRTAKKGLTRKIIEANNSQTVIKDSDFRSNDYIQFFIESELNSQKMIGLKPHKEIVYMRKRKLINKKTSEKYYLSMDVLVKLLCTYRIGAVVAQMNVKKLYDDDINDGLYWKIFGEGDDSESVETYSPEKMKEVIALVNMYIYLEDYLKVRQKEKEKGTLQYQALQSKWYFVRAISEVIKYNNSLGREKNIMNDFIKWKPGFKDQFDRLLLDVTQIIHEVLHDAYNNHKENENSINSGKQISKAFNYRNWLRSKIAEERIINKIEFKIEYGDFQLI